MRVLLADDHTLFRAGLATMLRSWGLNVAGEAANGEEAIARVRELRPDVVFMDIRMPRMNGLEATKAVKTEFPDTTVVMLTVSDEEHDLFEAIKSGAEGYLLKNLTEEEFADLVERITQGEPVVSPGLASKLLKEFARLKQGEQPAESPRPPSQAEEPPPEAPHTSDSANLTEREREVLEQVARGRTNREVAGALYMSENTVSFHMKNILSKLHLRNRSQVVAWALEHGLVRRPDDSEGSGLPLP